MLTQNLIFLDEIRLHDRPILHEFVKDIIGSGRHSEASQNSIKRFEKTLRDTAMTTKTTFLRKVLPLIQKHDRSIGKDDNSNIISEDWLDTVLADIADQEFHANCVPFVSAPDEQTIEKIFPTPSPDQVYGTKRKNIQLGVMSLISWHMEVCPNIDNPFFLIEAKNDEGDTATAMIQARRGGAALVKAMEEIWRTIHDAEYSVPPCGVPQLRSAIFTMILTPTLAELFVDWCQHSRRKVSSAPSLW